MQLQYIEQGKLVVSAANMRAGRKAPDVSDILPSVRARGVLVPLLVRPKSGPEPVEAEVPDTFEIVAGRRRFFAAAALAEETGIAEPLPCAVIEAGDDAAALEASLIENLARLDPDEVTRWETFTRLVKEGRSAEEIALTFGLAARQVAQVLALGNLLPRIRDLYRQGEIDAASVRLLTMATKNQQKEWLAMLADPDRYTPTGSQLKAWLFGGTSIPTSVALFDLASYSGQIVADLFGEEGYFAKAGAFWEAQRAAVAGRRAAYLEAGWSDVVVLEPGSYFNSWEYEKAPKKKGGKVYVALSARGEALFHEGYLSRKEAQAAQRRAEAGEDEAPAKAGRPEVTATMQTYIDLHRHAAVRAELVAHPGEALRLMAAHAIAGSYLFSVKPEPQRGGSNAVTESVETSPAETRFDAERRRVLAMLGLDADMPTVIQAYGGHGGPFGTAALFVRLLSLADEEVLAAIAVVMGEALEAGSAAVEAAGLHLGIDMGSVWQADEAFFDLIRDKQVLTGMLAELAGEAVASANASEKAKAQKAIIRDCLAGTNGREKVERWVPRWVEFPPSAYTDRGGVGSVQRHAEVAALFGPPPEPEPELPQGALASAGGGGAESHADAPTLDAAEAGAEAGPGGELLPEAPAEREREAA